MPHELHSDQGRNFESQVMALVCRRLDIHKTRTTPYHPQSDGLVERFNRSLVDGLAKVLENENEWDTLVPLICMQYRASTHRVTGCSPAQLMFGRELRIPLDVVYPPFSPSVYHDNEDYLDDLESRMVKAANFANQQLEIQWQLREKNCANYSKWNKEIDIGQDVYIFNPAVKKGHSPKFSRNCKGPYQILEQISDLLYRVRLPGRNKNTVVHRSRMHQPLARA